jgi:hypothetical protein
LRGGEGGVRELHLNMRRGLKGLELEVVEDEEKKIGG